MVTVTYPARILASYGFVKDLSQNTDRHSILSALLHIKASSEIYRGEHNVMLENDFNRLVTDGIYTEERLSAIVKKIPTPKFLSEETNLISKNIRYAIYLTNSLPFNAIILTSTDEVSTYKSNPHLNGVKSIGVLANKEAFDTLLRYYGLYQIKREMQ